MQSPPTSARMVGGLAKPNEERLRPIGGRCRAVRILLTDDQPAVLDLLAYFLLHSKKFSVIGVEENAPRAIRQARRHRPDIVLLGLARPGEATLKTVEELVRTCPRTRVIAFAASEEENVVAACLRAGVRGYVSRCSRSRELMAGIESVHRGEIFISQRILRRIALPGSSRGELTDEQRRHGLSQTEVEVVGKLADGLCSKEIAARMGLSVRTIEKYRESIKSKLRIRSIAEITKFAIRSGISQLD